MKINLIIFISEFNLGGAGNSIFKLCKNLPKSNFNITVICLNKCYYKSVLLKYGVKVIEINSNCPEAYLNLAKVLMFEGKYTKAKNNFEKAISIDVKQDAYYNDFAICF